MQASRFQWTDAQGFLLFAGKTAFRIYVIGYDCELTHWVFVFCDTVTHLLTSPTHLHPLLIESSYLLQYRTQSSLQYTIKLSQLT